MDQTQGIQTKAQPMAQQPSTMNPAGMQTQSPSEKKPKLWLWLVIILGVIIVGGAIYYFFFA